jgi:hypothetical protein
MSDATTAFFDRIAGQEFHSGLGLARGTVRFDIGSAARPDHWFVTLDRGAVRVTDDAGDADCVVVTDAATFDGIVEGRINLMSAVLRAVVAISGDLNLLFYFQRLFPAPQPDPERLAAVPGGAR